MIIEYFTRTSRTIKLISWQIFWIIEDISQICILHAHPVVLSNRKRLHNEEFRTNRFHTYYLCSQINTRYSTVLVTIYGICNFNSGFSVCCATLHHETRGCKGSSRYALRELHQIHEGRWGTAFIRIILCFESHILIFHGTNNWK